MQATTLKNPGDSPLTQTIRKEVARVISQLEDAAVYGTPDPKFAEFLRDAATKTPGYAAPALPATQQLIANAQVVTGVTVTGTGTTATFTVAGGKITGIALA